MPKNWSCPIYSPYIESQLKKKLAQVNVSYAAFFSFCIDSGEIPKKAETLAVRELKNIKTYSIKLYDQTYCTELSNDTIQLITKACGDKNDDEFVFTATGKKEPIKRTSFSDLINNQREEIGYTNKISYSSLRKTHFYHVYQSKGIETVKKLLHLRSIYDAYDYLGIKSEDSNVEYEGISDSLKEQIENTGVDNLVDIINKINNIQHNINDITTSLKNDDYSKSELLSIDDTLSNILLELSTIHNTHK